MIVTSLSVQQKIKISTDLVEFDLPAVLWMGYGAKVVWCSSGQRTDTEARFGWVVFFFSRHVQVSIRSCSLCILFGLSIHKNVSLFWWFLRLASLPEFYCLALYLSLFFFSFENVALFWLIFDQWELKYKKKNILMCAH